MSQFPPRVRPVSSQPRPSDPDARLRTRPEDHYTSYYQGQGAQQDESPNPIYSDEYQEVQKIKRLSFWSNNDPEPDEDGDWSERQSPSTFILAVVILVVACTLTWFMFRWLSGGHTGAPPIIQADTAPFKVRPDHPGGMMIPHQDKLVYGRLSPDASQPVERLLPPPEQLMAELQYPDHRQGQPYGPPPAYPPAYPQGYPPSGQEGYQPHPQMMPPPYPQGQSQMMLPPPSAHPDYPYGAPPQAQQPYPGQQPLYGETPAPQEMPLNGNRQDREATRYQNKAASTIDPIKPASDENEDDAEMSSQEGEMDLNDLIARESKIPVTKSQKKVVDRSLRLTPLDPANPKVQIASLPSRAMAEKEMRRLKDNHGNLFGNRPWDIQKITLGGNRGATYRLVVGSFSNRGNAAKFCSRLRAEGIGCMVVAPARE
jgi:hypothetical protein